MNVEVTIELLAMAWGCAVRGVAGFPVAVECDHGRGLPCIEIVGLPDANVREAGSRIRPALRNTGFEFPLARLTINLSPAWEHKIGVGLDVPMAVAILGASGQLPITCLDGVALVGELALDGRLVSVRGVLPACIGAASRGLSSVVVPVANYHEAALVPGLEVVGASTLKEVVNYLCSGVKPLPPARTGRVPDDAVDSLDFADVIGQDAAVRAVEVAVAGGHHVLLVGPPGTGKTLLASRIPALLPSISSAEWLDAAAIHSLTGADSSVFVRRSRPFRQPGHTTTVAGMIGGGVPSRPGEVTLAHTGVLFIDELCQFKPGVVQALSGPMEKRNVRLVRAGSAVVFPADFMLVASTNPCACGMQGYKPEECSCSPGILAAHRRRLSGPTMDRIDIRVDVPRRDSSALRQGSPVTSTACMKRRIEAARVRQAERYKCKGMTNAHISPGDIERLAGLSPSSVRVLAVALDKFGLSLRAYHSAIKVARTIADIEGTTSISEEHMLEALNYRTTYHQVGRFEGVQATYNA